MMETLSSPHIQLIAADHPRCLKCNTMMVLTLTAAGPLGFDIHTFDCTNCDHTHIAMVTTALPTSESRRRSAKATDALEEARQMPPGSKRIDALKKAGRLRYMADRHGLSFAKRGRPPK